MKAFKACSNWMFWGLLRLSGFKVEGLAFTVRGLDLGFRALGFD